MRFNPTSLGDLSLPERSARDAALRLLTRRDHSINELFNKLLIRGFPSTEINETLKQLQKDNILNEARFIESYIRSRLVKGFGPLKICAELGRHGIDQHRILSNEEWLNIDWQAYVLRAKKKKFGNTKPRNLKERAQQARFLLQRGFTQSQVKVALGEI